MRRFIRCACGLVLLAVLGGCTGEPAGEEPTAQASTSAPGVSATADSGGSGLAAEQLEAVLTTINEAESLKAQVIPDAEIRSLEEQAAGRAGEIAVTPEECNVYAESAPETDPVEATRAAMTFAGESSLQPDAISLSSFPSSETAVGQVQAGREQLAACSEFSMEVSGQRIMTSVAEVDVETTADEDFALRTTAQVPGTIQESLTVTAVVDSTVIDVLVGGSADPAADVDRAERLVNLVVAQLRSL